MTRKRMAIAASAVLQKRSHIRMGELCNFENQYKATDGFAVGITYYCTVIQYIRIEYHGKPPTECHLISWKNIPICVISVALNRLCIRLVLTYQRLAQHCGLSIITWQNDVFLLHE